MRDYIITVNPLFSLLLKSSFCMFVSRPFKITQLLKTSMLITSVQSFSCVRLFATPWSAARRAFLSIIKSWSLVKIMSIESVMPSSHLILCHPLLLLPSIFPSIRVFSNESALRLRWPKDWSFSFSISPSNEYSGLTSFRMDWLDLLDAFAQPEALSVVPQEGPAS